MAKKKACDISVGRDMNGKPLTTCDRVEISPHFDLWMRGARFGAITRKRKDGAVAVRMDHRQVRRLQWIFPKDLKKV